MVVMMVTSRMGPCTSTWLVLGAPCTQPATSAWWSLLRYDPNQKPKPMALNDKPKT